jgi:ribose transport system substrate-binding protein
MARSSWLLASACVLVPASLASLSGFAASATPDAGTDIVAYAKKKVEAAYKGSYRKVPAQLPKPIPGKNVWIISPGQAGESSSISVAGAKEAGETVGWKMNVYDGKGDASTFATGIRQALAAKADGIILFSIDCGWVRQALYEAKQARVKTFAFNALDCNDPAVKGEALFDGVVNTVDYPDYASLIRSWGADKADWVIAKTEGKAKVIDFKQDEFLIVKYIREGFLQELAKCKTCEVVKTVDFTLADFGPRLQQKTQGALLQHPEANAMHVPYDTVMVNGVAPAIIESGRAGQILVIGGEGFPSNLRLIRDKKGQDAANGFPAEWNGWAAVDGMNHVFHGQKAVDSGIGWQLIDREHNLPAPGKPYTPPVDFKTAYKKAWGV